MEEFNFDGLFEQNEEISSLERNALLEKMAYEFKLKVANENYEMIVKNEIDIEEMKRSGFDISSLEEVLNTMIEIFVGLEEYEKCSKIKNILEQI